MFRFYIRLLLTRSPSAPLRHVSCSQSSRQPAGEQRAERVGFRVFLSLCFDFCAIIAAAPIVVFVIDRRLIIRTFEDSLAVFAVRCRRRLKNVESMCSAYVHLDSP